MTNIEQMAREAGLLISRTYADVAVSSVVGTPEQLAKFAALVAEDLACTAESFIDADWPSDDQSQQARDIANAIRAKYPKEPG